MVSFTRRTLLGAALGAPACATSPTRARAIPRPWAWAGAYGNPVLLIMLSVAVYHHGQLGMQVIIEDYIHHEAVRFTALILVKLGAVFLAIYTIFSVVKLTFGG